MADTKKLPPQINISEYQLPAARQTEEIVHVQSGSIDMLLIAQQDVGRLLKVKLDDKGRPSSLRSLTIESIFSGLRGLTSSRNQSGCVWATLQFHNAIVLLDASQDDAQTIVKLKIQLPDAVLGPYSIFEQGSSLWVTCKDSGHIVRVNTETQDANSRFVVHETEGKPIFVAVQPITGVAYATFLDNASQILKIYDGRSWIDIPQNKGKRPLGIAVGIDNNIWFTLGVGAAFGRIDDHDNITWFTLPTPPLVHNVGLLHIAFDNHDSASDEFLHLWLLSSSLVSDDCADAVFSIIINRRNKIVRQDTVILPTYASGAHRVVHHGSSLYVTELSKSLLAHLRGRAVGLELKKFPYDLPSEMSDADALWGLGRLTLDVEYNHLE